MTLSEPNPYPDPIPDPIPNRDPNRDPNHDPNPNPNRGTENPLCGFGWGTGAGVAEASHMGLG